MDGNMTRGNPAKLILYFMLPLLVGNVFQQLYSMADTIIVGRTIGVNALAAVGATGSISFLIIGFAQGVTSGFSVITAQEFGAGRESGVRRSVAVSIVLSIIISLILTVLSIIGAKPMLEVMKTPSDIIDAAYEYITVIFEGIFAAVFYNLFSSILRAIGDSKTPLLFLIVACIINIVLDFVFILNFKMGVAGAAWATVIAQLASGVLCLVYSMKKYTILRLKKEDWKFSFAWAKKHLAVGLPMAFQFSITGVGVMINQSALNTLGSTAVAAFTAGSKIEQFGSAPLTSLGVAVATYTAQNYGAGRFDRIKKGVKQSTVIATICAVLVGAVVIAFSKPLTALFVGKDEIEVLELSREFLMYVGSSFTALGWLFVYRNALQGMGYNLTAFFGGVCELVMRSVAALVFVNYIGYAAVCLASPVAWIGAAVWLFAVYCVASKRFKMNSEQGFKESVVK